MVCRNSACPFARRRERLPSRRTITGDPPAVFSLGLVWNSWGSDLVADLLGMLSPAVDLDAVFSVGGEGDAAGVGDKSAGVLLGKVTTFHIDCVGQVGQFWSLCPKTSGVRLYGGNDWILSKTCWFEEDLGDEQRNAHGRVSAQRHAALCRRWYVLLHVSVIAPLHSFHFWPQQGATIFLRDPCEHSPSDLLPAYVQRCFAIRDRRTSEASSVFRCRSTTT